MSRTPDQVWGRLLSTNSGSVDSLNVATRCDCKARHQHGIQRGAEGVAGRDCYTAAKGGIAAITRSMAVEFAPQCSWRRRNRGWSPGMCIQWTAG